MIEQSSAMKIDEFQVSKTHLVEEHVLAVSAFSRKLLQVTILADSVLQAQLLPELATDLR